MSEERSVFIVRVDYAIIGIFSGGARAVLAATSGHDTPSSSAKTAIVRALSDGGMISIMFRRADDKVVEIEHYTLNAVVGGAE